MKAFNEIKNCKENSIENQIGLRLIVGHLAYHIGSNMFRRILADEPLEQKCADQSLGQSFLLWIAYCFMRRMQESSVEDACRNCLKALQPINLIPQSFSFSREPALSTLIEHTKPVIAGSVVVSDKKKKKFLTLTSKPFWSHRCCTAAQTFHANCYPE